MVQGFEVGWWQVCRAAVQTAMVVPIDVLQGGDLDLVVGSPRPSRFDQFGFEQPDRGLGQRIIVGIRDRADGGVDACCGEAFGEAIDVC